MTKAWQDFLTARFLARRLFFCCQLLANKNTPHAKWMIAAAVLLIWVVGIPWTFYKLNTMPDLGRVLIAPFA
jgi:glycerol uptake facilitator-like aquaporin